MSEGSVEIARAFHDTYERLAPQFGYETRRESAVLWDDVPAPNRLLMCAVVDSLLDGGVIRPAECSLPCCPKPGDQIPAGATERLGNVEYWPCPRHGSHSGQRRMFSWHDGDKALGFWEWTNVT